MQNKAKFFGEQNKINYYTLRLLKKKKVDSLNSCKYISLFYRCAITLCIITIVRYKNLTQRDYSLFFCVLYTCYAKL